MCMWFGFNPAVNFCHFSALLTLSFFADATSTSPKFDLYFKFRTMEYFRVAKFSRFCLKNMGTNFRGWQRPRKRKVISILFCENHRVGGTARISFDRSTVWKENIRPKYLKCKRIKDSCILTDKQAKRTYLHSDG